MISKDERKTPPPRKRKAGRIFAAKLQIVADRNFKIGRMFDGPICELLFAADGIVCKNENAKTEKFWLFPNNDRFWIGIKGKL